MKRWICSLLDLILLLCFACSAETFDLSSFTPEQLEALQRMIDAELAEQQSQPATFEDTVGLIQAMIGAGADIAPDKITDYTAETDPNGLLGTEGSYSSKTDFGCVGYANDSEGYVGGTIEYFSDAQYATNRFDYIKQIYINMPSVADQTMYLAGKYVLRLDQTISGDDAINIVNIFEDQLGQDVDDAFDPKGKITKDVLRGIVAAEPTVAPTVTASTHADVNETNYKTLQRGSKGTDVAKLQARLKYTGFLNGLADGDFGPATENAVRAFQLANGLEETGVATPEHQVVLFNAGVICADGSVAKAYDPYEVCPIELSRVDLKKSYGYNYVTFTAKNISTQDVKAVNCSIRYFDAFGDRITDYGTNEITVSIADIAVGKSVSMSTKEDYSMIVSDAASVEVAVTRVLMSDGTNLDYSDPVWFEGK